MSEPLTTLWNIDALDIEQNDEKSLRLTVDGVTWIDFYGRTGPPVLRVAGALSTADLRTKLAAAEREREEAREAAKGAEYNEGLMRAELDEALAALARAQALARAYRSHHRVTGVFREASCAVCGTTLMWDDDPQPPMCTPCIEREHAKAVEELGA